VPKEAALPRPREGSAAALDKLGNAAAVQALSEEVCPGKQFWLRKWLLIVDTMAAEVSKFTW